MKLETIINELETIKDMGDDLIALERYNKLIEDLKKDLLLKNCKKTTKTTKITAIKNVLNNKRQYRETLKKIKIEDDKMMFTDSYSAYIINKIDNIPFETVKNEETYPDLKIFFKDKELNERIELDYNTIKTNIKLKQEYYKINDNIMFDNKYLLNMLNIMPDNTIYYLYDNKMIFGVSPDEEEKALVLGVKVY